MKEYGQLPQSDECLEAQPVVQSDAGIAFSPAKTLLNPMNLALETTIAIVLQGKPTEGALRLQRLAGSMGVTAALIDIDVYLSAHAGPSATGRIAPPVILIDAGSFSAHDSDGYARSLSSLLAENDASILLLVTSPPGQADRFVSILTEGAILGTIEIDAPRQVFFPEAGKRFSKELASHTYKRRNAPGACLRIADAANAEVVMEVNGRPTFARLGVGRSQVFAWSTPEVFDLTRPLSQELEFEESADEYIPGIIFLRDSLGDRCWHNPGAHASIVIDDPLLTPRYGYIDFNRLLESARQHRYHVSLAFIPWNHRRTTAAEARPFIESAQWFSICVHGCDHVSKEYGAQDYDHLRSQTEIAVERMNLHRERLGMHYEPVMVCPQEQCSIEGWRALADTPAIIAMSNTGCMPRNLTESSLTGADLLSPAQDSFFGFPVLKRHYWKDMAPFAMSLFLGKPAILVEHHEFFQRGSAGAEHFADQVRLLRDDIRWDPLSKIATTSHWRKHASPQHTEIRIFSRRFEFRHETAGLHRYSVSKRVVTPSAVSRILVNDREVPFASRDHFIHFELHTDTPEAFCIEIEMKPAPAYNRRERGSLYHTGVALRRRLSEFRDNFVARNRFAAAACRLAVKAMYALRAGNRNLPRRGIELRNSAYAAIPALEYSFSISLWFQG